MIVPQKSDSSLTGCSNENTDMLLSDEVVNFYFEEMGASYGWIFYYAKRSWHGNWMRPCPIRNHYAEFHKMLTEFRPEPVDENAKAAMVNLNISGA